MPTNAKNAALLRVMVEIIRPQRRSRQRLPDSEENRESDAHPNSTQRVRILLFVRTTGNVSIKKKAHTNRPHRRRIVSRECPCRLVAWLVVVFAVIVAEVATVNNASALAGTWLSIQTKKSVRIAAAREDAPPVVTPESSRLES